MKRETIERLLLGSLVNNTNLFVDISDAVNPGMFTSHREEWAKITWNKISNGEDVSFHLFAIDYEDNIEELDQIFFEYNNPDGVQLAVKLRDLYLQEEGGLLLHEAQKSLVKGEVFSDVVNTLTSKIEDLAKAGTSTWKNYSRYDATKQALLNPSIKIDTIPTGFSELDNKLGGWPVGMNILAARPGMGKTTLTMWFLIYAVEAKRPCLFYSLEMTTETILKRLACYFAWYNANDFERFNQDQRNQIADKVERLKGLPLWIRDSDDFSGKVEDLQSEVFVMKKKHNIELVAIDYLQLLSTYQKTNGQYEKTNILSGTVRKAAQKNKLPFITLSQLSRAIDVRGGDKRPILSDLRDSGKIEEDAVSVTFIYRPEYYNILEDEEGQSLRGITELIFAKFRPDGSVVNKSALLKFNAQTGEFHSYDPDFESESVSSNPISEPISFRADTTKKIPF